MIEHPSFRKFVIVDPRLAHYDVVVCAGDVKFHTSMGVLYTIIPCFDISKLPALHEASAAVQLNFADDFTCARHDVVTMALPRLLCESRQDAHVVTRALPRLLCEARQDAQRVRRGREASLDELAAQHG